MEKELLGYIENFQLTDLLGFGKILNVEEKDDYADYLNNIIVNFKKEKRKKRKQLLKLAKDISEYNLEIEGG